ncbi:DUF1565 domain-containing protein [Methylolobus aquaticus]|nr:DUF1565 domain-containing protein [Methylolobus aquaticus]
MNYNSLARFCLTLALVAGFLTHPGATQAAAACTHYVATTGKDTNPGTLAAPWRTLQKAANTAEAGNVVCARGGVYAEAVKINVSGSAAGGYITFQSYPGETTILDGSTLTVRVGWSPLVWIQNKSYIIVRGFELRNYRTSLAERIPIGIFVSGAGSHIQLHKNRIHHIETNYPGAVDGDAHGIAVYGTAAPAALTSIVISGNRLYNLKLGSSEALAINGNVNGWQVLSNVVHDTNNIGIDAIGFEGQSPDPAYDQARNGVVRGNRVYNVDSYGNPAYGAERSAGCLYVDGGKQIVIERNVAHHCNLGVELASEHARRATSYVTLRNNFIYANTEVGITIGGYDTLRGRTERCTIVNNTLLNNDTHHSGNGELLVQYDTRYNVIKNNIFYANAQKVFISSWSAVMTGNVLDTNLFFVPGGGGSWQWKNVTYATFAAYKAGTGNDAHSLNQQNPLFISTATPNLHLQAASPAIDKGQTLTASGTVDFDGQPRHQGASLDLGADEVR